MVWQDEDFEKLEEEEYESTLETFALLALLLSNSNSDIEKELALFYQKYGKNGIVNYQESRKKISKNNHRKRINELYLTIDTILDALVLDTHNEFKSAFTSIINREMEFFNQPIDVEKVLSTTWGVDELNWEMRLTNFRNRWDFKLANDLKLAMLKNEPLSTVIKKLSKDFGSMENGLWTLYTTEYSAIQSITRHAIFKEMGVKKYRYYARADERTCDTCGSMHGLIFPMTAYQTGVTASPMHPHCRCWEVPIME